MRKAELSRETAETKIRLSLDLDGSGTSEIETGCGFLDHMLVLFARHGRFDLTVHCEGDMDVDAHHTTEDIAIVLGRAFDEALGDDADQRVGHEVVADFHVLQADDRAGGVVGVQCGKDQMAGDGGADGDFEGDVA